MSSTAGWQSNYNGSDQPAGNSVIRKNYAPVNAGWSSNNHNSISTPFSHPDGWPQLGVQGQEQDTQQSFTDMQDTSGWNSQTIMESDKTDSSNGWGSLPASSPNAGWGDNPNWSRPTHVDNGTAVWGKAQGSVSQSSTGWGAPSSQGSNSSTTGWNAPQTVAPQTNAAESQQTSLPHTMSPHSKAPDSWAKAAAQQPAHSEQKTASIPEPEADQSQAPQEQQNTEPQETVPMTDREVAVHKLVNCHDGWGKRPIQQNTSWNVSDSPDIHRKPPVNNGTEAWGKLPLSQGSTTGWSDNSKPSSQGIEANDQTTQQWVKPATTTPAVRGWGAPGPGSGPSPGSGPGPGPTSQTQTRLSWNAGQPNPGNQTSWGDQRMPPPMSNMNSNRWGAPPNVAQNSSVQGWTAPPQQTGSSGWNNQQPAADNSSWSSNMQRNSQSSSGWGARQSSGGPEANWVQPQKTLQRLPSQVDDGTSAWGDPTAYKSVNMWDKQKQAGMGDGIRDINQPKSDQTATGWGGPSGNHQNKPSSPTAWGDTNQGGSSWDQGSGWGQSKPNNSTGWGNSTEQQGQQWGQNDSGSGWNHAAEMGSGKGNVDFGFVDRKASTGSDSVFEEGNGDVNAMSAAMAMSGNGRPGMNYGSQFPGGQPGSQGIPGMNGPRPVPPQQLMNQSNLQAPLMRNQGPPMPPQLQNQLQQIRHAVMKGVIPQQMLNPQLMTPRHLNLLQQLVMKTTERQQLIQRMNVINKQPNLPLQMRENILRMIQQCEQQIQAHQRALTQNMLQKTNQMPGKPGVGLTSGLDMNSGLSGALPPTNSGMAPFNMASLAQNLPTGSNPNREHQSRLNTYKRPSVSMDGSGNGDPQLNHPSISDMIGGQNLMPTPGGQGLDLPNTSFTGGGLLGLQQAVQDIHGAIDQANILTNEANGTFQMPTSEFEQSNNGISSRLQTIDLPTGGNRGSGNNPSLAMAQDANGSNLNIPEFIPGVQWKGFRPIDPEIDPDITPGSVAIAKTMSVNTVKDVDQVLNRDRYANSQADNLSSGGVDSKNDVHSHSLASSFANSLSDNPAASTSTWSTAGGSSLNHTPTSFAHELWKVPLPGKQSSLASNRPPPGVFPGQNSMWPPGPGSANSWSNTAMPSNASSVNRFSNISQSPGWTDNSNKTWVVLNNLNPQMDFSSLRNLCAMKGNMLSFEPNSPMHGMVLVRYATADDALAAKKALNMSMAGNTMLVASITSDQDVSNFVSASAGNTWNNGPGQSRFSSRSSFGSSGTMVSQQQPPPSGMSSQFPMMHGSSSTGDIQRLWANSGNAGYGMPPTTSWSTGGNAGPGINRGAASNMWGSGGYDDPSRMMSPLHSLLPENLLGEQSM